MPWKSDGILEYGSDRKPNRGDNYLLNRVYRSKCAWKYKCPFRLNNIVGRNSDTRTPRIYRDARKEGHPRGIKGGTDASRESSRDHPKKCITRDV